MRLPRFGGERGVAFFYKPKYNFMYTIIVLVFLNGTLIFAQDQDVKILDKFIVPDSTESGVDVTPHLLENEAYLSFYELAGEDAVYFANVWPVAGSISHGAVYSAKLEEYQETEETYARDEITFYWKYKNTYDNNSGTAKVKIQKIYKPQGIYFEAYIVPEDMNLLLLKGYVEGTLNLAVYDQ